MLLEFTNGYNKNVINEIFIMSSPVPAVLLFGHSFVRRLRTDISSNFDARADKFFGLQGSADVHLFGVGGRTVASLAKLDLPVVSRLAPEVIILEIGTSDLAQVGPEVMESDIADLVSILRDKLSVRVVCVCHVIPHGVGYLHHLAFKRKVQVLNQVVRAILEPLSGVFVGLTGVSLTLRATHCYQAFT
jgi:hypothetical protein